MDLNDIITDPKRHKIFDIILEEACRQWCEFIGDAPERADGEGFAQFFYDIFEMKEQEYLRDLGISSQKKPSIRRSLEAKKAEIDSIPTSAQDKGQKKEATL